METVDLKAYWEKVSRFSQYPEDKRLQGYRLGLRAEAGELAGVVDKWLRGKYDEAEMRHRLLDEAGDICWYSCAYIELQSEHWLDALSQDSVHFLPDVQDSPLDDLVELITFHAHENSMHHTPHWSHSWRTFGFIAELAAYCDTTLQAVLDRNVAKLTERHA